MVNGGPIRTYRLRDPASGRVLLVAGTRGSLPEAPTDLPALMAAHRGEAVLEELHIGPDGLEEWRAVEGGGDG